jgi:aspartyl-tRNA(Asn)/glutamyl-tRNA(Gln) amidotransferase subunit B
MTEYVPTMGLEVHAQLLTKTKLFCSCPTTFGNPPNDNTCPVCLGLPGALPVLNRQAVEYAIRAGLATNSTIAPKSVFARKNYFYPDLPKGYQISQYELPLIIEGHVDIVTSKGPKKIRLERIHMEEDAGKNLHEHPETRATDASWIDLNRACVPLIEIVSKPDIDSIEEAIAYLKALRAILVYLGINDGNLEEGSFRCDANISIRPQGQKELGTRTELKNMNSFKNIEKALIYEIERQTAVLSDGESIIQETRLWNGDQGKTESMRSKEEAHDYRYFPDPDLLPLIVDEKWIESIRHNLPELPAAKKARLMETHLLPEYDAEILTQSQNLAHFFEECVKLYNQPKKISNWIMTELLRELKNQDIEIHQSKLTPKLFTQLLELITKGTISNNIGKEIFVKMMQTGESPEKIIAADGLAQVSDSGSLEPIVDEVFANNPDEVARLKSGDQKLMGFFVGQVMKASKGKANPKMLNELIKKKLK